MWCLFCCLRQGPHHFRDQGGPRHTQQCGARRRGPRWSLWRTRSDIYLGASSVLRGSPFSQMCFVFTTFAPVCSGLILPNGDINWNCPCLGGMASGPCGSQFKEAFSCFHYSKEEIKGSECIEQFRNMQECMQRYPELYPQEEEKENPTPAASDSAAASESDSASSGPRPEAAVPPDGTLPKDNSTDS